VPERILQAVRLLMPGDVVAFTEVNYRSGQISGRWLPTPEQCLVGFKTVAESYEVLHRHFHEHPIVMGFLQTRSGRAERLSDKLSAGAFHKTAIYGEFYRRMRVEDQLVLMLPTDPGSAAGVAVSRGRRSFRPVHVDRLDRLGPHLLQPYRNAERITSLEGRQALRVDRVAAALDALGLGRRESDVLRLIASGYSNAEAARELGVSPLTIKKRLEHIYAALSVGTRSAAVARLLSQLGFDALTRPSTRR
jgi:DNA-binding CsgD family transcriptional regulator